MRMRASVIKIWGLLSESPKSEHVRMTISQEITWNHQRTKKGNNKTISIDLIVKVRMRGAEMRMRGAFISSTQTDIAAARDHRNTCSAGLLQAQLGPLGSCGGLRPES